MIFSVQKRFADDRGVALLFSLGVLSALMLLGIAFINSSLFSRRIAESRSRAAEANILARSAANMAAAGVLALQEEWAASPTTKDLPSDYRGVFSVSEFRASTDPTVQNDYKKQDKYREYLRFYPRGGDDYSRLDVPERTPFAGKESLAQWVYVKNDDGAIIGRYAYQVLPLPGRGQLNFYRTMLGQMEKTPKFPGPARSSSSGVYSPKLFKVKPYEGRWGQSPAELHFDSSSDLAVLDWSNDNPEDISSRFIDLYAPGDIFSRKNPDWQTGRAWFESTFTEGTNPGFREIAPGGYARFDLSEWDEAEPWYARFGRTSGNVSNADAASFVEDDLTRAENFSETFEPDGASPHGLPFLRYIGADGEKGGFDTVGNLRRQIAANFNDYCDADSIPTSDKAANSWSQTVVPTYTGNEKTLYVNELMLGWHPELNLDTSSHNLVQDTSPATSPGQLALAAELIDVYGNLTSSDGYRLKTTVRPTALTVRARLAFHLKYTDSEGVEKTESKYEPPAKVEVDLNGVNFPDAQAFDINFTGDLKSGYATGFQTIEHFPLELDLSNANDYLTATTRSDLAAAYQNDHPGVTVDSGAIYIDGFDVVNCSLTCEMGNVILSDASGNVDYVNTNGAAVKFQYTSAVPTLTTDWAKTFFVGGMEAIDPRQNLNVRVNSGASHAEPESDWYWTPVTAEPGGSGLCPGTMFFAKSARTTGAIPSGNTLDALFSSGLNGGCNVCSDPSAPLYADCSDPDNPDASESRTPHGATPPAGRSVDCDKEKVHDPAWLGKNVDQHISTAVIRNAPMKSPWELGFIHRGIPFQTINLKRAATLSAADYPSPLASSMDAVSNGTTYANGDGGILDWIKMTRANYSYGKINLDQFIGAAANSRWKNKNSSTGALDNKIRYRGTDVDPDGNLWKNYDKALLKALFFNIPLDTASDFVEQTSTDDKCDDYITKLKEKNTDFLKNDLPKNFADALYGDLHGLSSSLDDRSEVLNLRDWETANPNADDDAAQEEIIGRTMNLLTATAGPPTVFRAVVIAQTIQDLGGVGSSIEVVSSDHPNNSGPATIGTFDMEIASSDDPDDNVHYDVILGESKILVTYEYNPATGKIAVRDIENID